MHQRHSTSSRTGRESFQAAELRAGAQMVRMEAAHEVAGLAEPTSLRKFQGNPPAFPHNSAQCLGMT